MSDMKQTCQEPENVNIKGDMFKVFVVLREALILTLAGMQFCNVHI